MHTIKPVEAAAPALARAGGHRALKLMLAALLLGGTGTLMADQASDVAALEAKCEAAREAKIKPLREGEIAKCKASRQDDPSYCDRFWSDYGNARRLPNGTMSPRMFDDLPACVDATRARQALTQGGR